MSALEHIRKRPALVISVLGAALLLFIFTGIDNLSSLVTDRDSVAKVDGTKIKYNELAQRTEMLRRNYEARGSKNMDSGQLQQEALNSLIEEAIVMNAIDRLGIEVTDEEFAEAMRHPEAGPYLQQMVAEQGSDAVRDMLLQSKYQAQFGALATNRLDAMSSYNANAHSARVAVARKDFSTLNPEEFEPTDDEIASRYSADKQQYKLERETRLVDYILLEPAPSVEDRMAAQQEVEQVIVDLNTLPGTEGIADNYNFSSTTLSGRRSAIRDNAIAQALDELTLENPVKVVSQRNNNYVIAKLLSQKVQPDSAFLDFAIVEKVKADSVMQALAAGATLEALGDALEGSQAAAPIVLTAQNIAPYAEEIMALPTQYEVNGNSALLQALFGGVIPEDIAVITRLDHVNAPVTVYQVAKIEREVAPSKQTLNEMRGKLRDFLAKNGNAADFKAHAVDSGYLVRSINVDASNLQLLGKPSTSYAARWVMEAKKGQVSDVFEDQDDSYMLALAVQDVYKDYVPASDEAVRENISGRLRAEKMGKKLVGDYAGKANSLAGYASLMSVEPDTLVITYGGEYIRGFLPGDPNIHAKVAGAKKGQLVGPFETRNSVAVIEVVEDMPETRPFDFEQDGAQFAQREGANPVMRNMSRVLRGNKKVDYKVQRFSSAD